ncbi:MAG: ABC transporter substrate-binding protein, partial [Acidimicrobiales bacterium]
LYVNQINKSGGINGRKIKPIIVPYDPTNDSEMRALCKDWTLGSPAAFAVIDGIGAWAEDGQLCITQEGHTPLISQWTTIPQWTEMGSPYLWWTGPDQAAVLKATVQWASSSGLIGHGKKLGIIVGDRQSDQDALKDYLLPDLKALNITPVDTETIAAGTSETSATSAQAPLVVAKLKQAGAQSVFPLIPFNVFFPMLQAQTSQQYFPKLVLSDYEESIESALGLIPTPYNEALNGQEGLTTETLGGFDDNRPESKGGYDPGARNCYNIWHKAHPKPIAGTTSKFIEEQGPIQAWCTAIELFATAAKKAGKDLNRRTFVEAMASVKNFAGGFSPTWSYGPDKFAGPVEYQVVRLHNNVGKNACVLKTNGKPQGTCWQVVKSWKPLPAAP